MNGEVTVQGASETQKRSLVIVPSRMALNKVLQEIEDNHIEMVRFEMTDFYGISHCKGIPSRHFKEKVENGIPFYGGQMVLDPQAGLVPGTGYNEELAYRDMIYHADLATFRKLPWAPETARVLTYPKYLGNLVKGHPRNVAERLLGELTELGYSLYSSHEYEFFVVDDTTKKPITNGVHVRATTRLTKNWDFLKQILKHLPPMGVDLESLETEYAPGQFEIPYKPSFGLEAADNAFTFKNGIKEIAQQHGYQASFTTKPYSNHIGASGHLNHSLWDEKGETNVMHDANSPDGLSKIGRHWIAGLLFHAPAITVLCSPTVNCMTRLARPAFTPTNATWGVENRTTALRVKTSNTGKGTYVENRIGSSGGCPYISLAATVAAGIDGIKNEYEPPPPVVDLAYQDENIPPKTAKLPTDMESAVEALLADKIICKAMGEEFIKAFVAIKKHEMTCEVEAVAKGMDHAEWARNYYFEYM